MTPWEREVVFEYWLHSEAGYSYIGENSYYRLTLPELNRLYSGFQVQQREERKQLEQENPELRGKRVRRSDREALRDFKQKHGFD